MMKVNKVTFALFLASVSSASGLSNYLDQLNQGAGYQSYNSGYSNHPSYPDNNGWNEPTQHEMISKVLRIQNREKPNIFKCKHNNKPMRFALRRKTKSACIATAKRTPNDATQNWWKSTTKCRIKAWNNSRIGLSIWMASQSSQIWGGN